MKGYIFQGLVFLGYSYWEIFPNSLKITETCIYQSLPLFQHEDFYFPTFFLIVGTHQQGKVTSVS